MSSISLGWQMPADAGFLSMPFGVPPYRLSGAVYGALMNHRSALEAVGDAANLPPYDAPPRAPVLCIKPRNTLALSGDVVRIPVGTPEVEVGACVGVVIGRTACRVSESQALDYAAGYLIVADVSIPHVNYHRPSVRFKAQDGFCPLGPAVTARAAVANPDDLIMHTYVDGALVQTASTAGLIRPTARLLADVTEFMTLAPGDVLTLGAAGSAPRVRPGQTVTIRITGLGSLEIPFMDTVA
jgi:5-oxopent-3-ene-1,2,5-tricarboxylate decarboxylase/2-hydroxyhepta-2,4-diene-1,7-dioate isomerase